MKLGLITVLWVALATTAVVMARGQGVGNGSAQAQSAVIRVTSPLQGTRQTATFVDVRYELTNPTAAASGSPNFKVQLDDRDPVVTTTTEQNFTGLTRGPHVVTLQLVDANGTVVPSSETQVQFTVVPTAQNGAGSPQATPPSGGTQTTAPVPQASNAPAPASGNALNGVSPAEASVPLPFISIIGFGVLVGGIITTVRTRSRGGE